MGSAHLRGTLPKGLHDGSRTSNGSKNEVCKPDIDQIYGIISLCALIAVNILKPVSRDLAAGICDNVYQ